MCSAFALVSVVPSWGGYSFSNEMSSGMRKGGRESSKTRVSSDNSQVVHVVFLDDSDEA